MQTAAFWLVGALALGLTAQPVRASDGGAEQQAEQAPAEQAGEFAEHEGQAAAAAEQSIAYSPEHETIGSCDLVEEE